MSNKNQSSRRKFLQQIGSAGLLAAASPLVGFATVEKTEERIIRYNKKISPADKIRLAVIGFGIQGHGDLATALKVPGVELAGGCMAKIFLPPKIMMKFLIVKMWMQSLLLPAITGMQE